MVPPGTVLTVGEVEELVYDHRDQQAVPCTANGQRFYMLVRELGPDG